ncbi:MAG TPA: Asp-tRNA(Asn)/Glu-tRNA(Gln) amidotransferase subunit GatB, partial [Nitrospirales bacterium]|nr:Asp-tRNA(Asn)/Glu-tRNA(Gln) amidotransferase subunit GatB [Nitrospirales bacterium]
MPYEVVIGLEVHAQLSTASKMFCACSTRFGQPPNTQTCPICLGLPGSLPVINEAAVKMAVRTGLALNCTIRAQNRFARKNYFYPDLPKGYQISQYEAPICEHGTIEVSTSGGTKKIRIRRAHLEEDAGKNVHGGGDERTSLVDLNRAGTPLLEIVTEPDMRSADEVVAYLKQLRDVLVYLDVCDGNMEQGSLRCEPNLSLRPVGAKTLGTKVELKNINSFRFVKDAIEYEIKRQTRVLDEGGKIQQETRLWDVEKGMTAVMRSKEEAHDYRYFPDPDLVPVQISDESISEIKRNLPKLSGEVQETLVTEYNLPPSTANVLVGDKDAAGYFLDATAWIKKLGLPLEVAKELANWATVDLRALLNEKGIGFSKSPVTSQHLVELIAKKYK